MKRLLLVIFMLGGLNLQSAHADPLDRWERRQEKRERAEDRLINRLAPPAEQDRISAGEAARLAQMRNGGGRVLEVLSSGDGWRVKLIKDGEVRVVFIPATQE